MDRAGERAAVGEGGEREPKSLSLPQSEENVVVGRMLLVLLLLASHISTRTGEIIFIQDLE